MKGQYSLSMESVNISQTRTIVPRLYYSNSLLAKIIDVLKHKKSNAKKSNQILLAEYEDQDPTCTKAIDLERTVSFSI